MNRKLLAFACFIAFHSWSHAQCLIFPTCPDSAQTLCDLSDNDAQLWNESYWNDPLHNSHNLPEGPADLSLTVLDTCGGGPIDVRYKLYLDLDHDGAWETVVRSDSLPGYNTVYFGNANGSGTARAFDERPVMANQKYGFALQTTTSGDSLIAYVRWNTEAGPDTYIVPELPFSTHKIEWTVVQNGHEKVCAYSVTLKDCKKPVVGCHSLTINMLPIKSITLWHDDFIIYKEDNVTPAIFIQSAVRKVGSGSGFPLTPEGLPQYTVTFNCDDLGITPLEVWVIDKYGNTGYCQTTVIVQDNTSVCGDTHTEHGICVTTACADHPLDEYTVEITGGNPALPPVNILVPMTPPDNKGCINIDGLSYLGNYLAKPVKDNDHLNGVSTFDLVLINKHILGLQPFDAPHKLLAADANNSKTVTTFDIVEIRKLILGLYTELPNNTSWRFYPADFALPSPNPFVVPIPGSDTLAEYPAFKAVKVGDVNCSAISNSAQAPPEPRGAAALDLPDVTLKSGETLELPLRVAAGDEWAGFQFALEMDPDALEVEGIVPGALPGLDENAYAQPRPGLLTVSWFDAAARRLTAGETLMTLKVRARRDVVLSETARLNMQRIAAEAYTGDEQVQALQLFFSRPASGVVQFFAPRPNPAAGPVSFPLRLEQAGPVLLTISDLAGKVVFEQNLALEAGWQELRAPAEALRLSGAYLWRINAGGNTESGKLIRL